MRGGHYPSGHYPSGHHHCERCEGTGYVPIADATAALIAAKDACSDCQGHGYLLQCRCGHLMAVGDPMCSLCEAQAEAREEER